MNDKAPSLRRHVSGQYMVRWGGRDYYLGRDRVAAQEKYLSDPAVGLPAWSEWRASRDAHRFPPLRQSVTVLALAEQFLENRELEGGRARRAYYRTHLRWFVALHCTRRAESIRPIVLQNFKDGLIARGYQPKTVNHHVQAVKTMMQWAQDLELIPALNLHGVKLLRLGPIADKTWAADLVRRYVFSCDRPALIPWLAVNYLAALRPIEVVRIARGEGEWIAHGVMRIPNKMGWKNRMPRVVLLSAEAFGWLRSARTVWTDRSAYCAACARYCGAGPHQLRHSAAAHLSRAGIARADVDQILGHYPGAVSLTYTPPEWLRLRPLLSRITLRGS